MGNPFAFEMQITGSHCMPTLGQVRARRVPRVHCMRCIGGAAPHGALGVPSHACITCVESRVCVWHHVRASRARIT
eukprot:5539462-Prymnesium_polylepis.1